MQEDEERGTTYFSIDSIDEFERRDPNRVPNGESRREDEAE